MIAAATSRCPCGRVRLGGLWIGWGMSFERRAQRGEVAFESAKRRAQMGRVRRTGVEVIRGRVRGGRVRC